MSAVALARSRQASVCINKFEFDRSPSKEEYAKHQKVSAGCSPFCFVCWPTQNRMNSFLRHTWAGR